MLGDSGSALVIDDDMHSATNWNAELSVGIRFKNKQIWEEKAHLDSHGHMGIHWSPNLVVAKADIGVGIEGPNCALHFTANGCALWTDGWHCANVDEIFGKLLDA